ncbi:virulence gene factor [Tanapox virus]|uniref:Early protein OPG038 n=1 Tax=Tanapox virus TaxID=99000 RepID=A7XCB0_9POXV|nr:virulence gene factor [Tanapox virus]ABQ43636.1 virulence gene factor [Tanapox virus]
MEGVKKLFNFLILFFFVSTTLSYILKQDHKDFGKCVSKKYRYWNLAAVLTLGLTYTIPEKEQCFAHIHLDTTLVIGYGLSIEIEITNKIDGQVVSVVEGLYNNNTIILLLFIANDRSDYENSVIPNTKISVTCTDIDCDNNPTRQVLNGKVSKNELIIFGSCLTCVLLDTYPNSIKGFLPPSGIVAKPYSKGVNEDNGYLWYRHKKDSCNVDFLNTRYGICSKIRR